jgi:hypothetical protein
VRSMRYVLKELRRTERTFMSSHEQWVKYSGVRANDRSVYEHKSLSKVLELLGSYDQLALCNLAGAEAAVKRRMVIEQAYEKDPGNPSYEGSDHVLGYSSRESGAIVDPEVVKYKTARLKEEHTSQREMRLKKEEDDARHKAAQAAARNK